MSQRRRQRVRNVARQMVPDIKVGWSTIEFRIRARHDYSSFRVFTDVIERLRPHVRNIRPKIVGEPAIKLNLKSAIVGAATVRDKPEKTKVRVLIKERLSVQQSAAERRDVRIR